MFTSKKTQLFENEKKQTSGFVEAALKKGAVTRSGNDAIKYDSTGDDFVDQFGTAGKYREQRSYTDISKDMATLWAINPYLTVCFTFFLRMITRIVSLFDGKKTEIAQRGAGLRHEGNIRMLWLAVNYPNTFWKNINLYISIGSWKDIIQMLQYDLSFNGWEERKLNWHLMGGVLLAGLENPNTVNLVKKYLPQIKAKSKCTTVDAQADNIIAKWICSLLFPSKGYDKKNLEFPEKKANYKTYRQLKVSGTAHQWQQLISQGKHLKIDFNTIHGRALSLLVSGKYLANNGLEKVYEEWISNKPIAKFTGYVYELASKIKHDMKKYQADTINSQYNKLLEIAGKSNTNFIVVKDTSGSMNDNAIGTKVSSYHIAKSLSIFLGNMLQGFFHNCYIDFSSQAILRKIKGSNFVEHWNTEERKDSANTDFLQVARLLVSIYHTKIAEDQFPKGIICISDGQFDITKMYDTTNIVAFKNILHIGGFSKAFIDNFKFCFWDIRNDFYGRKYADAKFESFGPEENVFYFGGFDPSVITFLTGIEGKDTPAPKNARELFNSAMDQQVMKMIEI